MIKILHNQRFYYFLFLIVLLVPNIALCITEPYSLATTLAALLIPVGGYTLFLALSKRPGIMMFCAFPFIFFGAFQLVLLYLFGGSIIAVDMFLNLFTTNASEAGELLDNIMPAIIGVCVLYIPMLILSVFSIRSGERLKSGFRRRALVVGICAVILGYTAGFTSHAQGHAFGVKYQVFPVNVIYNLKLTFEKWGRSMDYPQTAKDFIYSARKDKKTDKQEIYVLVIGEAARADNWELFGYERNTNPLLKGKEGLVAYGDALTMCNATHKSVPMILAPASAIDYNEIYKQKSLITAFKEVGFHTVFITNQVPNRSLIDYFASEADELFDVSPRTSQLYTVNRPDGEMLPIVRKVIGEADGNNLLIVLHTYGSHFNYKMRYPEDFARFMPDYAPTIGKKYKSELINSYDNSVVYTDYVMNELISTLDSTHACTALLYSADHGEDILDDDRNRFLHASPTPTYYQLHVACFGWFSPVYRETYTEKYTFADNNATEPTGTASMFHTMVDMADIQTPYLDKTYSLTSNEYEARERYYLNDHDQAVLFYNSGLAPEDFDMMKKKGIQYDRLRVQKVIY